MKWMRNTLIAVLLLAFVLPATGCRKIRFITGIGEVVKNPEGGSPEELIQSALTSALIESQDRGWNKFRKLIHPEQKKTLIQREEWQKNRFPRLRRQVKNYVIDPSLPSFTLLNIQERNNGRILLHIENIKGDVGTPCTLKQDGRKKWKLWSCSL